jgi:hypothetical protein
MSLIQTLANRRMLDADLDEAARQFNLDSVKRGERYSIDDAIVVDWPRDRTVSYRYFQVEHLLDQAADLLDRGLRDRQAWDELFEKWFANAITLRELVDLSTVQKDEEAAYALRQGEFASQAELDAAKARIPILTEAVRHYDVLLQGQLAPAGRGEILVREGALAQFGTIDAAGRQDIRPVGPHFPGDDPNAPMQVRARAATEFVSGRRLEIDYLALMAQNLALQAELAGARALVGSPAPDRDHPGSGLESKAEYEKKDSEFKRRRRDNERNALTLKLLASVLPGGPLNYQERMEPIQKRYQNDFQHAVDRLYAASEGLEKLYGYEDLLPKRSAEHPEMFIGECVSWVRRAINFKVQFDQLDEKFILTLSLKALTAQNWSTGRTSGLWSFNLNRDHIPHGRNVFHLRLREIAVYIVGEGGKGTWNIAVKLPGTAESNHIGGARKTVDQSSIPPVLAGAVTGRTAFHSAQPVGSHSHRNTSPLGDNWQVRVDASSLEGIDRSKIDDIQLDLYLSARVLP